MKQLPLIALPTNKKREQAKLKRDAKRELARAIKAVLTVFPDATPERG